MMLTIAAFPDGGQIPVQYSQAAPGAIQGHILGKAVYGGLFRRPQ